MGHDWDAVAVVSGGGVGEWEGRLAGCVVGLEGGLGGKGGGVVGLEGQWGGKGGHFQKGEAMFGSGALQFKGREFGWVSIGGRLYGG